jgi:hypothetical protein
MALGTKYTGDIYIQSVNKNSTSIYDLLLQPNGGNVGIGTASPNDKLEIYGATDSSLRIATDTGQAQLLLRAGATARRACRIDFSRADTGTQYMQIIGDYQQGGTDDLTVASSTSGRIMTWLQNGNVGIGTVTPRTGLHVHKSSVGGFATSTAISYFDHSDAHLVTTSGSYPDNVSIFGQADIATNGEFVSLNGAIGASDRRIKKNIIDVVDGTALETLRLLKPKKYQYKDEIKRGQEPVWGFIAQEVKETLPHATQLRQDVLPNIYELANVSSSNVITFTNFNTSNLESNATTLVRTMGIDGEQHDVHLAEVIDTHTIRVEEDLSEWIGSVDAEGNVITEITTTTVTPEEYEALEDKTGYVANISGYQNANVSISVEEYNALEDTTGYEQVVQDYTKTSTTRVGNQLFVYGQEVDDFVFLKKEAIWTVATAALQEVDRQLQAEKAKVADLLARVAALENA